MGRGKGKIRLVTIATEAEKGNVSRFASRFWALSFRASRFVELSFRVSFRASHFVELSFRVSFRASHFVELSFRVSFRASHFVSRFALRRAFVSRFFSCFL